MTGHIHQKEHRNFPNQLKRQVRRAELDEDQRKARRALLRARTGFSVKKEKANG